MALRGVIDFWPSPWFSSWISGCHGEAVGLSCVGNVLTVAPRCRSKAWGVWHRWGSVGGRWGFSKGSKAAGIFKRYQRGQQVSGSTFFFIKVVATQIFLVSTPNPGEMIQFDYFVYYLGWNHPVVTNWILRSFKRDCEAITPCTDAVVLSPFLHWRR